MRTLCLVLSHLIALSLCGAASAETKADKNAIRSHIDFLADDLLEGRETGSRGYDIAAKYVSAQFAQQHVGPMGDKGSYLQRVPLRAITLVTDSASVEIHTARGVNKLSGKTDFIVMAQGYDDPPAAPIPMVFVGYGIRADRFKHDDFAGVDVKGKIVVALMGNPGSFPTEEGAHFGSSSEKRKLAARLGAVGMVFVVTPAIEKIYPFAKMLDDEVFPSMTTVDPSGKAGNAQPGVQDGVILSMPAASQLFAGAGVRLDDIFEAAANNKPIAPLDLKASLRIARKYVIRDLASSNVVGVIEGSDPRLKHEYVVFSAHLDHVGTVAEKSGDNIYNGAMDNASGVATLLETARLFGQSATKPKRSVLFVALTGEEKGLLGSKYFAENPTVPKGSIVANVNLDMPLLTFDFNNVMAFGVEHSSLKGATTRALKRMGLALIPDPWPTQGLFTRSDHYSFVREGIPSIFLATGMGSFNKQEDGAKLWGDFLGRHYHEPSDDRNLPFNFDAAARFALVNYHIGREIADAKERPTWNKGDFFGDTFRK